MKQVNGIKFYSPKNGNVRVVFPDGKEAFYPLQVAEDYYHRLLSLKLIDTSVVQSLKDCGLTLESAHLGDCDKLKEFRGRLKYMLRANKIDFSFQTVTTPKLGIEVGGNVEGITSSVIKFLWSSPWKEIIMSTQELEMYLKKHKKIDVYERDDYYSVKKCSRSKLWSQLVNGKLGSSYQSRGIGSASSVVETKLTLLQDAKGNLCISKVTLVWD